MTSMFLRHKIIQLISEARAVGVLHGDRPSGYDAMEKLWYHAGVLADEACMHRVTSGAVFDELTLNDMESSLSDVAKNIDFILDVIHNGRGEE